MVVLVRVAAEGRGLIYTSASFSGQSEICTVKLCLTAAIPAVCQYGATKSACPTAAKKRLSASICLCRRCRSQPLSSVSRKQRYNTLDFASKIVCQQGCYSPLLETQSQGDIPLWTPHIFFAGWYQNCERQFVTGAKKKQKEASAPGS